MSEGRRAAVNAASRTSRNRKAREADDAARLLRLALRLEPDAIQGRAARRAAERTLLRNVRTLQRVTSPPGGRDPAVLDALGRYLAVHALWPGRQLRRSAGAPQAALIRTLPLATTLVPPTRVWATVQIGQPALTPVPQLEVSWYPAQTSVHVDSYVVSMQGTANKWTVPQTVPTFSLRIDLVKPDGLPTVITLTAGQSCTFTVQSVHASNASQPSPPSDPVIVPPLSTPVGGPMPVYVDAPQLAADPVSIVDPDSGRLLAAPAGIAGKWRREYLLSLAMQAAQEAMTYEQQITALQSLEVGKVATAELLTQPVLSRVMSDLQKLKNDLTKLQPPANLNDLVGHLADAVANYLLLQRLILWLSNQDVLDFWRGLFDRLIKDIATFSSDLHRTRQYVTDVLGTGDFSAAFNQLIGQLTQQAAAEVDQLAAPLRAAVADLIASVNTGMAELFKAFDDEPLLMSQGPTGRPDAPNVSPFDAVTADLEAQVEKVINDLKTAVVNALLNAVNPISSQLFTDLVIAYLVLPILAALVIGLAGGPFGAAALAGAVLIAGEELLHLVVHWLSGPIAAKLGELQSKVDQASAQVQSGIAAAFAAVPTADPSSNVEQSLQLLGVQVRELADLLPKAFLRDAADLLGRARDAVLDQATGLALAAEQALGMENATAVDVIAQDYKTSLAAAPQLPGGSGDYRLAAARLVADLGRLEAQRVQLLDGKEMLVRHRLSLFSLLGGTGDPTAATAPQAFAQLLQGQEVAVQLSEERLIDRERPGLYRCLLSDVQVSGVFTGAFTSPVAIPVRLVHTGESRTRIKSGANPSAPPIPRRQRLTYTDAQFTTAVLDPAVIAQAYLDAQTTAVQSIPAYIYNRIMQVDKNRLWAFYLTGTLRSALSARFLPLAGDENVGAFDAAILRLTRHAGLPDDIGALTTNLHLPFWHPGFPGNFHYATDTGLASFDQSKVGQVTPPPTTPAQAQQDATLLTPYLTTGDLFSHPAVPGLLFAARTVRRISFATTSGKWGAAYLEQDRDENVSALGFVTLVRSMPEEGGVLQLEGMALSKTAAPAVSVLESLSPLPMASELPAGSQTYGLFENRGLEGVFTIRLPTADGTGLFSSNATVRLVDLILEVTHRACYDADLEATLRASAAQKRQLVAAAGAAGGLPVTLPGTVPAIDTGIGRRVTVHMSLRAQRDGALAAVQAAIAEKLAQGQPGTLAGVDAATVGALTSFARNDPFTFIPRQPPTPNQNAVQIIFQAATPAPTTPLDLAQTIYITPQSAGLDLNPANLAGLAGMPGVGLVSLGIAPVPSQVDVSDQLRVTVTLGSQLAPLLQLPAGGAVAGPLITSIDPEAFPANQRPAVDLQSLFTTANQADRSITIDLTAANPNPPAPSLVYDVILSLTFVLPLTVVTPAG